MNDNLLIKIPPRKSKSVFLEKNQKIKIINTHGTQVVDTWCFNQADIKEFMSMEHNRAVTSSIFPKEGEFLYTNKRQPILYILKDSSPGRHDTLIAACDNEWYMLISPFLHEMASARRLSKPPSAASLRIAMVSSQLRLHCPPLLQL